MQDDQKEILGLPEPRGLETVREHHPAAYSSYAMGGGGDLGGEEENHFRSYLRAIRKHLWLILGITLIVTSLVTTRVAVKPAIFPAQPRVQVDLKTTPAVGAGTRTARSSSTAQRRTPHTSIHSCRI